MNDIEKKEIDYLRDSIRAIIFEKYHLNCGYHSGRKTQTGYVFSNVCINNGKKCTTRWNIYVNVLNGISKIKTSMKCDH